MAQLYLLKCKHIDDVQGAPIVNQYSVNVKFLHSEHNHQWIVIGLSNATSISFEKKISGSLLLGVFDDENREWMLFNSLMYGFFNDLEGPPITSPFEIILISPT